MIEKIITATAIALSVTGLIIAIFIVNPTTGIPWFFWPIVAMAVSCAAYLMVLDIKDSYARR